VKNEEAHALLNSAHIKLIAEGFRVIAEDGPDAVVFGDWVTELQRGPLHVVLSLDRLFPSITMRAPGGSDYGLDLWEACLEERDPSLEVRGVTADVDLLLSRLPEFERLATERGSALDDCLARNGRWRFFTRRERGLIRDPGED
jgi:hypothetical protein